MKILKKLLIKLLYLTPIGYVLSLFSLFEGDATPGVYIQMSEHMPIKAYVSKNPHISDRASWLFNGALLILQGAYISIRGLEEF
jgi:hypothetical protein